VLPVPDGEGKSLKALAAGHHHTLKVPEAGFSIRRDDSGETQGLACLATSRLGLSWARQAETSARSYRVLIGYRYIRN
jgi:hypothetical protein